MSLANSVIMIEPRDFGFNQDTATDNAFQHYPDDSDTDVTSKALSEFWQMVELLDKYHLEVLTLPSPDAVKVPDAVFPNNWFSTFSDEIIIYPMRAANRQLECQPENLVNLLTRAGFVHPNVTDLRVEDLNNSVLEGTGVLVFDHTNDEIYANISERCEITALTAFEQRYQYKIRQISAFTSQLVPIYHTNVLMAIGLEFVVIAEDCLAEYSTNKEAISRLKEVKSDFISISETQMVESFCGNIIQLQSTRGEPLIVMSESARRGFTNKQLQTLEKHGTIVSASIPTIEYVGGGSARCMLAENFLQKA